MGSEMCIRDSGVGDVVDQRDVLVADALDVVLTETVVEHRRAFERLDRHDLRSVFVLQVVACSERSGGAGRRHVGGEVAAGVLGHVIEDRFERGASDGIVADVVRELAELVEDDVDRVERELVAGVVDLLDVALRAEGLDCLLYTSPSP